MPVFRIDDPCDLRIADYRNIRDGVLLVRQQAFVAEGRLVVRRLLASDRLATRSVLVTAPALAALEDVARLSEVPVYLVPQPVMDTVSGINIHRGCLAIGERPGVVAWRTLAASAERLVVLERVANADNVGAIFRNAAAFGVDAVLLGAGCADPLYRKAIRTSMAATLTIPFARMAADGEEPSWPDSLGLLRADGVGLIGLSPSAEALPLPGLLREIRPAMPRVAILAGHEGEGLTREALSACDHVARIPMAAGHDSLNIATAVAIALYQLSIADL